MGPVNGKPIILSSDDLEIVDIGENFYVAVLNQNILQKPIAKHLSNEIKSKFLQREVFLWYNKAIQSISLAIGSSEDLLDIFQRFDKAQLASNNIISAETTIFNEARISTFISSSCLADQISKISKAIPEDNNSILTDALHHLCKIATALEYIKQPSLTLVNSIEERENDAEKMAIKPFLLGDVFGENMYTRDLEPFGITWEEYETLRSAQYPISYRLMRGYIPLYVVNFNLSDDDRYHRMIQDGLPTSVCHRLLKYKILWLLCIRTEDILLMPISFFDYQEKMFEELDIVELSALWFHLPKWSDLTRFIWRAKLKLRLDNLVFREKLDGLEWELTRDFAYGNDEIQLFDPDIPLETIDFSLSKVSEELNIPAQYDDHATIVKEEINDSGNATSTEEGTDANASLGPPSIDKNIIENTLKESPTEDYNSDESEFDSSACFSMQHSCSDQDEIYGGAFPITFDLHTFRSIRGKEAQQNGNSPKPPALSCKMSSSGKEAGGNSDRRKDHFKLNSKRFSEWLQISSLEDIGEGEMTVVPYSKLQQEDNCNDKEIAPPNEQENESSRIHEETLQNTTPTEPNIEGLVTSAGELNLKVALTPADTAFVDFDLMPDQIFMTAMEDIKQKRFSLCHIGTHPNEMQTTNENNKKVKVEEEGDDEEEGDLFDENSLLSIPFKIRPELTRENTFMVEMDKAMMTAVQEEEEEVEETIVLKGRSNNKRLSRPLLPLKKDPTPPLPTQKEHRPLNSSLSFLLNRQPTLNDENRSVSITAFSSSSPPNKNNVEKISNSSPPTADTRSTLLSVQQDMMRVANEVGDEIGNDSLDIVAALTLVPKLSHCFYEGDEDGNEEELNLMDVDFAMVSEDEEENDGDNDHDTYDKLHNNNTNITNNNNNNNNNKQTISKSLHKSMLQVKGLLEEQSQELSVFIDQESSLQPVAQPFLVENTAVLTPVITTHHRPPKTNSSHKNVHSANSRNNSTRKLSHSGNISFVKRRSMLVETVSSALDDFLHDTDSPSLISHKGYSASNNSQKDYLRVVLSTSLFTDAEYEKMSNVMTKEAQHLWDLWHEDAKEYYQHMAKEQEKEENVKAIEMLEEDFLHEEKTLWEDFNSSLLHESRSDATYESMMHEYIVELILTGDVTKAQAMLEKEPHMKIPASKATQILHSLLSNYHFAVINKRTSADPPTVEVIRFLIEKLHGDVTYHKETQGLLRTYYKELF